MRTLAIVCLTIFSAAALAETATIDPTQDNTLYESSQGALSNGAGGSIFSGMTTSNGARRAVIAFKDLSAIPDGATIESVELHLFMNKENSDPTTINVYRLQSDWGEGASDAPQTEGAGVIAQLGDATWNHAFFDNVTWITPGGDFDPASRAQLLVGGVGLKVFGSSASMVSDVEDWLDNPADNFGWILVADETVKSAKRFASREATSEGRRPRLVVEYSVDSEPVPVVVPGSDFSGPWFDPGSDGEGFLVFNTPAGWLIYFFGYSADGDRLWLVSNLIEIESLVLGQTYEFTMLVGTPGSFETPTPSADLETWGTLQVQLNDCATGVFVLNGEDGLKNSNVSKLIGVDGTSCMVQ